MQIVTHTSSLSSFFHTLTLTHDEQEKARSLHLTPFLSPPFTPPITLRTTGTSPLYVWKFFGDQVQELFGPGTWGREGGREEGSMLVFAIFSPSSRMA